MSKITSKDIAKIAGVSQTTVSYVLNNKENTNISEDTKKRVLKVASELGYVPNHSARSLVSGKTNNIRVWISSLESHHVSVVRDLEQHIYKAHYNLILNYPLPDGKGYSQPFSASSCPADGVFAFDDLPYHVYPQLRNSFNSMPYVSTGCYVNKEVSYVEFNINKATTIGLEHLKDCNCKKIALIINEWMINENNSYYNAYLDFCLKHNYTPIILKSILDTVNRGGIQPAYKFITNYLKQNTLDFDGLFAVSDDVAIGALGAFTHNGVSVPEDVKICGCNGQYESEFFCIPITTVKLDTKELCNYGWEFLNNQIIGKAKGQEIKVIEPSLIVRKSTIG